MKVYKEQIHIGGQKLCKEIVGGHKIKDKYYNNENNFLIQVHFFQVWMSINYSHRSGSTFY
jgi:hypothetical protein